MKNTVTCELDKGQIGIPDIFGWRVVAVVAAPLSGLPSFAIGSDLPPDGQSSLQVRRTDERSINYTHIECEVNANLAPNRNRPDCSRYRRTHA
jgi:hypothetical protein